MVNGECFKIYKDPKKIKIGTTYGLSFQWHIRTTKNVFTRFDP